MAVIWRFLQPLSFARFWVWPCIPSLTGKEIPWSFWHALLCIHIWKIGQCGHKAEWQVQSEKKRFVQYVVCADCRASLQCLEVSHSKHDCQTHLKNYANITNNLLPSENPYGLSLRGRGWIQDEQGLFNIYPYIKKCLHWFFIEEKFVIPKCVIRTRGSWIHGPLPKGHG